MEPEIDLVSCSRCGGLAEPNGFWFSLGTRYVCVDCTQVEIDELQTERGAHDAPGPGLNQPPLSTITDLPPPMR